MQLNYNPHDIEKIAQTFWKKNRSFFAEEKKEKQKFYCLSMLPYPSGNLHMGHVRNYTIGDVIARYQRLKGKNVLHPIGWDAFGLPAENAAIKHNLHPFEWTYKNILEMRKQLFALGMSFDWSREITTCNISYYKWEQWLFIQLYKKGLVYYKESLVNWDPIDKIVLANEQVINGRSWRSMGKVVKKKLPQWFLKISIYRKELLKNLEKLEKWPQKVRSMQKNWIGLCEGMEVYFPLIGYKKKITIFIKNIETIYGITYILITQKHNLLKEVFKFDKKKQDLIAMTIKKKENFNTGKFAIHPLNQKHIPIWVSNLDYLKYDYDVVAGIPGHNKEDYIFANKYKLPIKQVILSYKKKENTLPYFYKSGICINSDFCNGLEIKKAKNILIKYIQSKKIGNKKNIFRLKDWNISRQRYWGCPIPIIHCDTCGKVPELESNLPVKLPIKIISSYKTNLLQNLDSFKKTICPKCKKKAFRETNTFDTFMESSWYFLRYTCPDYNKGILDYRANYWLPVDQYIGGIEHAIMHLLYARFINKVFRDLGLIKIDEPFIDLITQGMVLKNGEKMSKSKGNIVSPSKLIKKYGADTIRLFIIFSSPISQTIEWSESGVKGSYRFLQRLWKYSIQNSSVIQKYNSILCVDKSMLYKEDRKKIHIFLQNIIIDMKKKKFNTVVAFGMKLLNFLERKTNPFLQVEGIKILLQTLNPIIPHITHVLWIELKFGNDISLHKWPSVDKSLLKERILKIIVQINGKKQMIIPIDITLNNNDKIKKDIINIPQIKKKLKNKFIKNIVFITNKLINIITN